MFDVSVVKRYFINLYTGKTWEEYLAHGGEVTGFRDSKASTVKRIKAGDILLAYVTGISRFIAVQEVKSSAYRDEEKIWSIDTFPWRLKVNLVAELSPEAAIPIVELRDELSIFEEDAHPNAWTGWVRGSPREWRPEDGEVIVAAVESALNDPSHRPYDQRKWARVPARSKPPEPGLEVREKPGKDDDDERDDVTDHTEIQWLLLKLGSDMGLDTWVARNDRGKSYRGYSFSDVRGARQELPRQFDDRTNRIVSMIDLLWLEENTIVAAFEIESTTAIYSGLLRMSDLVAMQPNLKVPLFLVAPESRRDKVSSEIGRPTFASLRPPLSSVCQFISFETLRDEVRLVAPYVRVLKHSWIYHISEPLGSDDEE